MKISAARKKPEGPSTQSIVSGTQYAGDTRVYVVATRALWSVILLVHLACGGYYAFVALLYHTIPTTLVGEHMKANQLMMEMRHVPVLVGTNAVFSALHAAFLCEMVVKSMSRRALFFHSRAFKLSAAFAKVRSRRTLFPTRVAIEGDTVTSTRVLDSVINATKTSLKRVERTASGAWERSFGATGLFGVGGQHFVLIFLVRETIETALQSIQSYSLSKYVPRVWLNRLAVAVVVASCWSTPAVHKLLHKRSPREKLVACLLIDTLLDIASSIGTPVALGAMYLPCYSIALRTFEDVYWLSDAWVANLNSEFKQLFIQSWYDFSMRALFAATLLMSLDDVKLLAAALADKKSRPVAPNQATVNSALKSGQPESAGVKARHRFEKFIHTGLIVWGFVVLGLHLSSSGGGVDMTDCMVRVRPWLATKPTCVALQIDCSKHPGMVGASAELEARWAPMDTQAIRLLIFRRCVELRVPASIRSLPNLSGFYIYSSTMLEWSESAALSSTHHPSLRQISLIVVNMTAACDPSSSLPPGLLARDFPQTLGTFLVVLVPLDKLPQNLPEIWPRGLTLMLMDTSFNFVPDVLLHMAPVRINLQYNNITSLPAAIFEISTLKWLEVGTTPLRELPEYAEPSPSLLQINLVSTGVESLPEWMARESFLRRVQVVASSTPLCAKLHAALDTESKTLASRVC
ncbi:hypothetical protein Gpo141_00002220 [Globisporangium polare]